MAGDIVALTGCSNITIGDTLIEAGNEKFVLKSFKMPPPVFISSIEYQYLRDRPEVEKALTEIMQEDNSLIVEDSQDTGQILVHGLGELHLEVVRDKLKEEYGLEVKLGKMKVSYKESVSQEVTYTQELVLTYLVFLVPIIIDQFMLSFKSILNHWTKKNKAIHMENKQIQSFFNLKILTQNSKISTMNTEEEQRKEIKRRRIS